MGVIVAVTVELPLGLRLKVWEAEAACVTVDEFETPGLRVVLLDELWLCVLDCVGTPLGVRVALGDTDRDCVPEKDKNCVRDCVNVGVSERL